MKGIVYFGDGHTESILFYTKHEDDLLIEFHTVSGRYIYYEYLTVSINGQVNYKTHKFYKSNITADDFGYVVERLCETDDILKIELEDDSATIITYENVTVGQEGYVSFCDGRTEPIRFYRKYSEQFIEFHTDSTGYIYVEDDTSVVHFYKLIFTMNKYGFENLEGTVSNNISGITLY